MEKMYEVGDITTDLASIVVAVRPTRTGHVLLHVQAPQTFGHDHVQYIVHRVEINPEGKRILWSGGYFETIEDAVADYADRR